MTNLLHTYDLIVVVLYVAAIMAIGLYVSFKSRGSEDLFLGGRTFGWRSVGLSLWGTNVTPSFLIGSIGAAYTTGMVTANFEWLAWIFLMLLGMVFAPHYLKLKIATLPEVIRARFGEATYRVMTLYTLYGIVILWLGGALYPGGVLLSQIMGWPFPVSILVLVLIATSFTVLGGLVAVVVTDAFQTILIILGASLLTIIGLYQVGGIGALIEQTPPDYWTLFRPADDEAFPWPAIILGYPVLAIWFWCTDQTIVQRVLGARDLENAQKGTLLAAFLKILPPFLFTLPGMICFVLYPGLENPDDAFVTMVRNFFPIGLTGLMIAVLISALISSIDSGLNSFSTVFTLDVYVPYLRKDKEVSQAELRRVGRYMTVLAAVIATLWALAMDTFAQDIFNLLQSLIAFLAPPMTALFLSALFFKRATGKAAFYGFVSSVVLCQAVGLCSLRGKTFGLFEAWPHYLWLSFWLFIATCIIIGAVSYLTAHDEAEQDLSASVAADGTAHAARSTYIGWGVLAVIMVTLYVVFQTMSMRATAETAVGDDARLSERWPSRVEVFQGTRPQVDGVLSPGEYADATRIDAPAMAGWAPQFSPVSDADDLSATVWIKHDGESLFVAIEVFDDTLYGYDTPAWLPAENASAHAMTVDGFPWFGDGVELLIDAAYTWSDEDGELNAGDATSWQLVASTYKSWLGGEGAPGLMFGEERSSQETFNTHIRWIEDGLVEAVIGIDAETGPRRYVVEWRVSPQVLQLANGAFWSPDQGTVKMGLNLAVGDLDTKQAGAGNWGNFHHENWWAGERDKRTWLKQWGTMVVHPGPRP